MQKTRVRETIIDRADQEAGLVPSGDSEPGIQLRRFWFIKDSALAFIGGMIPFLDRMA